MSVSHTIFVWIESNGKFYPQLWTEDIPMLETRLTRVVSKRLLTTEDKGLSLDQLAKKYPHAE